MEKKMTKREMQSILKKLQKIQCKDFGAHDMDISVYHRDDDEKYIWLVCYFYIFGELHTFGCYRWRSYEDNMKEINKELEFINHKIEK